MSRNIDDLDLIKVVMVGDQAVGKTQLLSRLARDEFDSFHQRTMGVEFATKTISFQNKIIKLQVWDTSGESRFLPIITSYFRGADIMLLVIAGTDKVDKIRQITDWLKTIHKEFPENLIPKIAIIENKIDEPGVDPLDDKDLAQFSGQYELFIRCSAHSSNCQSHLITTFQSILKTVPKLTSVLSKPDSNAAGAPQSLAIIQHLPSRNAVLTTANISHLNEQQADLILKALHNLLIQGPVHAKHYKINFGKGKSIDNTKFGEPNNGEKITVPEHAHRWITAIREAIQVNSQNKVGLLSQLYIQLNTVADEKPFSRNATTQDFYQHCLPGFIEQCSKPSDAILNNNYFTILDNINNLSDDNLNNILIDLISHLEIGNQNFFPDKNARYSLGFWGGKTHKLQYRIECIAPEGVKVPEEIKVPEHVASLLDYLINNQKTPIRDKLIFALNYAMTIKCSTSSSRHNTTQAIYDNLPGFIADNVRALLNPSSTLQLQSQ